MWFLKRHNKYIAALPVILVGRLNSPEWAVVSVLSRCALMAQCPMQETYGQKAEDIVPVLSGHRKKCVFISGGSIWVYKKILKLYLWLCHI